MPQDIHYDIESLKEWIAKESHLPKDFEDFMLRKFLHSCHGSLEKTKKCIERFCETRANMTEVYTSRDPASDKMRKAFSITSVSSFDAGSNEILIHQLDDPTLESFNFYDTLKAFCIQADVWLKDHDRFPDGHIIILDIKDYTLKIITKVNIMFFRDFLIYLLEAMPVRVKEVHVVNCPSYCDKLFALVKPALPKEIVDIIAFHTNHQSLINAVGKQYLPVEFDGDAPSMRQQHQDWLVKIDAQRKLFLNDNMWKSTAPNKKSKNKSVENTMSGSFKTLCID